MGGQQGCCSQISQESSFTKLKHVDMRFEFLCDQAKRANIVADYIKCADQPADLFTKPMSQYKLVQLRKLAGLSG